MPGISRGAGKRIVHVTFEVDTKTGQHNLDALKSKLKSMNVEFDKLDKSAQKSQKSFMSLGRILDIAFGINLARMLRNIGRLPGQFMDAAASAETYRKELEILTGSTSRANVIFNSMVDTSLKVSHSFQSIMRSITPLALVVGHSAAELKKWTMASLDMAAGLKTLGFDAKTISANLVKILVDSPSAAIAFYRAGITQAMGFVKGVRYTLEERKAIIWKFVETYFAGAAEKMGDTWYGLMTRMKNQWEHMARAIMEESGLFQFIKGMGEKIFEIFENLRKSGALPKITETILSFLLGAIDALVLGTGKLLNFIAKSNEIISGAKTKWGALKAYVSPPYLPSELTNPDVGWFGHMFKPKSTPLDKFYGESFYGQSPYSKRDKFELVFEQSMYDLAEGFKLFKNTMLNLTSTGRGVLAGMGTEEPPTEKERKDLLAMFEKAKQEMEMEETKEKWLKKIKTGLDAKKEYWRNIDEQIELNTLNTFESMRMGFTYVVDHFKSESRRWADFTKGIAENMTSTFDDMFFGAIKGHMDSFGEYWQDFWLNMAKIQSRHLAEMTYAWLSSSISGLFGAIFPMGGFGATPLKTIKSYPGLGGMDQGGIATSPALVGERYRPEDVVPLPNGRAIPVDMRGGGSQIVIEALNINAVDSKSFIDMCERNPGGIMKIIHRDLMYNQGLSAAIQNSF